MNQDRDYWRRWAFAAAANAGLDDDDRVAVAGMIVQREIQSWSELSLDELRRVTDGLRGWAYVEVVRQQKGLPKRTRRSV